MLKGLEIQYSLVEFYQRLSSEPICSDAVKVFVDIMYSIMDDIQKFKQEKWVLDERKEFSCKSEKKEEKGNTPLEKLSLNTKMK